jgi:DNA-directed RNA polymerase subunit omega
MMIEPPIERMLDHTDGRFTLVVLAARRARQINAYFNQLGDGVGAYVPPQVHSLSRKPLSIAFEEITEEKVVVDGGE